MAPKTHAKAAESDAQQLKTKLETEPLSKSLTGTVIPDETSFNIEAEIKALGGLEVLVPGKLEPTLIRQHLDESLLKAFNCACNLMLRDIKAPPQSFHDPERGDALTIAEYDLALGKVAYEKDLNLHKAAEMSGDAGAQNFIENRLLKPAMLAIQRCAHYVTQIRRVGKGTGEYQMDHHMLMGVDVGELTVGQVLDPMTERMSVHMQPPTKRARTAADGIGSTRWIITCSWVWTLENSPWD
ncbi:unnamed protein product, partial [Closterium sp. Naga37s-1]